MFRKALLVLMAGAALAVLPVSDAFANHTFSITRSASASNCTLGVSTCTAYVEHTDSSGPASCTYSGGSIVGCTVAHSCHGTSTSTLPGTGTLTCTGASSDACAITGVTGSTSCPTGTVSGSVYIPLGSCLYLVAAETTTNALGSVTATSYAHVCVDPTGPDDF